MKTSWVPVVEGHDFPIQNLPFGIFEAAGRGRRAGIAIGDFVLDLQELGLYSGETLNQCSEWRAIRQRVASLLDAENPELRDNAALRARALHRQRDVRMCLPFAIGDYVDFYSSIHHATNVGRMLRPDNPLMPNWRWLPVGYHGKAGTVVVSGTPVRRPRGQISVDNQTARYAPSARLDFELETGFFIGADLSIFGMVLLNDWSARDVQRWEYQPLGPFLAKSFATTISPWVVTLDALEPFRVAGPPQDPPPLDYLKQAEPRGYDIHLEVLLNGASVCRTNFRHMYWSMAQQLAHLTSNGAAVRSGDLCGSGTISGPDEGSFGSLLEIHRGAKFLNDGDTVVMRGWCEGAYRIGFGECRGTVIAA